MEVGNTRPQPGENGQFREQDLMPRLAKDDQALLRSQSGPMAGMSFLAVPVHPLYWIDLRLPFPLSSRRCRCGRLLDSYGHHRASCATAGVLGRRGFAVENAAARICREAGGRVSTNVWVRDLDLPVPVNDARRLEIVVDGLPLHGGAQFAVDTTLVSVLKGDGTVLGRGSQLDRVALRTARRRKERTCPELVRPGQKGEASVPCWRSGRAVVGGDRLLLETSCQSEGEKRTSCAAEEGRAGMETSVGVVVGMCSSTCFRLFTPGEEGVRRC